MSSMGTNIGTLSFNVTANTSGVQQQLHQLSRQATGGGFAGGLKGVAHGIKGNVRPARAIAHAATGGLGAAGIGAMFGPQGAVIGQVIDTVIGGLKMLGDTVISLAAAANPQAMEQFNSAMKDLYATVGRQLVPVLKFFTQVIRGVADFLARIQGLKSSQGLGDHRKSSFGDIVGAKQDFALAALDASSSNSSGDPAVDTAKNTNTTAEIVQKILDALLMLSPPVMAGKYALEQLNKNMR